MAALNDNTMFSPIITWGQNKYKTYLTVDLAEITSGPEIDLQEDHLSFKAQGSGARGQNNYCFDIILFLPIDPKTSKYKVTGRCVQFELTKVGVGEVWSRLTHSKTKCSWIKADFDHFTFDDSQPSSEDEEEEQGGKNKNKDLMQQPSTAELMSKLDKELKEAEVSAIEDMKRAYLFIYNMFQWVGYSFIFFSMLYRHATLGADSRAETFSSIGPAVMVCQFASVLEVIHPLLGLVRTGVWMPLVQVVGRSFVLFALLSVESRLQSMDVVWCLFLTWSTIEVIRYPYYMLNVIGHELTALTWLRYTAWIPLYPLGFLCEGIVILLSISMFQDTKQWTIVLPNTFNCSFDFTLFLRLYLLLFLSGMYSLMKRMYQQRKRKLYSSPSQHLPTSTNGSKKHVKTEQKTK